MRRPMAREAFIFLGSHSVKISGELVISSACVSKGEVDSKISRLKLALDQIDEDAKKLFSKDFDA